MKIIDRIFNKLADKLYKYSTYANKVNEPLIVKKRANIQKIKCEMVVKDEAGIGDIKARMASLMLKDIYPFIDIECCYNSEYYGKIYRGQIKIVEE